MNDTSDIVSYVIWFGMPNQDSDAANKKIEYGLRSLWEATHRHWDLVSPTGKDPAQFEPYKKVGTGLYLLHTEYHWSPGDVCGFLKSGHLTGAGDEVIAIVIDQNHYIPWHGLSDRNARATLNKWKDQAEEFSFCRREVS